jgi:pimeloyl-ACP methyl ester carboxylesterase
MAKQLRYNRRMLKRLVAAGAALSAPGVALTIASERMIRPRVFHTGAWHPDPPDAVRWRYEEAEIYTPDALAIQGWLFRAEQANAPTILFMHGTSYNASDMWVTPERASAFNDFLIGVRANFFVFDYRGFGRNVGTPTEEGTYTDAAAALGWLYQSGDVDPTSVFYYGFSLGTGIATELALREPPAGLILRAPFTSVRALALDRFDWLRWAFRVAPWLPLTNYDTLSKVPRLECPLLVMHGDADRTVPEYMGQQIFEAAPEPKTYVQFPDSGHSDISADLVVPPITSFIDRTVARQTSTPGATGLARP